ncbi:MAG TPA: hypothetical protein VFW92_04470 [Candidatus Limnocylindrales bacterium]|nr:hypothetical protein [Candidatus Limnocylindrales bacterium]
MTRARVPAVGGERSVPEPDAVARDYLLLALRLDQHAPGLIDAYFGPAELKARAELEPLPSPERLADDAAELRSRVPQEVAEHDRAAWLERQLMALETRARVAAGAPLGYRQRIRAALDDEPADTPEEAWVEMRDGLEQLVPGRGPLRRRLAEWDARWIVAPGRLGAALEAALPWIRDTVAGAIGEAALPDGETVESHVVTGARSAGAAEFLGGLRTRIDISADLPRQLPELVDTLAHETYAGHHLDYAARETERVEGRGWVEATIVLIGTPEEYLSEGLAVAGTQMLLPPDLLADAYRHIAGAAGLAGVGTDAETAAQVQCLRERGIAAGADAALRIHEAGASPDEVVRWLVDEICLDPERARARTRTAGTFGTALFGYAGGARLVQAWSGLDGRTLAVPRFRRLLGATTTPSLLRADLPG